MNNLPYNIRPVADRTDPAMSGSSISLTQETPSIRPSGAAELRAALTAKEEAANTPVVNEYGLEPKDPNIVTPVTPLAIFRFLQLERKILITAGKLEVADVPPAEWFKHLPSFERETPHRKAKRLK